MSPTRAFKNKSKWSNSSGKCQKKKKKEKNVKSIPEIYFLDKNKKIISTIGETRNKA